MFCISCGKELPDTASFCLHCGKPLPPKTPEKGNLGTPESSSKNNPLSARTIGGVVILGFLLLALYNIFNSRQSANPSTAPSLLRPFSQKLVNENVEVAAGSLRYWTFRVEQAGLVNAHVVGTFKASGGLGNDIQVVLAEETEFQNWLNGHSASVLYGTQKVTAGRIDVPITKPGTYVIGFSNKFSLLSGKNVSADVELQYLVR